MVTASHNDNGWTGVRWARRDPSPSSEEMGRLKEIVLSGKFRLADGGSYRFVGISARAISTISRAA